ncbi:MAG: DNA recombination protein RmuC [Flavobacteriales bacterium]|nr:DNA recombination protein RmuC [Flavobacteriales bacterium]
MNVTLIISLCLFIVLALVFIFYIVLTNNAKKRTNELQLEHQRELTELKKEVAVKNEKVQALENIVSQSKDDLTDAQYTIDKLKGELIKVETNHKVLLEKSESQKQELDNLNKKFQEEFETISNKLLKDNSEYFFEANKKRMDDILHPFKEKINSFEKIVKEVYIDETKERSELKRQIKDLMELNKSIGEEANNLTNALKGDTKVQGNWGELILERVLENSGLVKGTEYETQFSATNSEGKRIQPDLIVKLPDRKYVIIDSKVSLQAYEAYSNSTDTKEQEELIKKHVQSVKNHIKVLSEKNYASAKGLDLPDFILLFMPLESSFSLALKHDPDLYAFAWKHKIVMVSPTTLLATLRTIAAIWKQEKQNKNALLIAEKAGRLYDKFVGFLVDLRKIQAGLATTQKVMDAAMNKMSEGSGNLIKRAEEIRKLGAKTSKELDDDLFTNNNVLNRS